MPSSERAPSFPPQPKREDLELIVNSPPRRSGEWSLSDDDRGVQSRPPGSGEMKAMVREGSRATPRELREVPPSAEGLDWDENVSEVPEERRAERRNKAIAEVERVIEAGEKGYEEIRQKIDGDELMSPEESKALQARYDRNFPNIIATRDGLELAKHGMIPDVRFLDLIQKLRVRHLGKLVGLRAEIEERSKNGTLASELFSAFEAERERYLGMKDFCEQVGPQVGYMENIDGDAYEHPDELQKMRVVNATAAIRELIRLGDKGLKDTDVELEDGNLGQVTKQDLHDQYVRCERLINTMQMGLDSIERGLAPSPEFMEIAEGRMERLCAEAGAATEALMIDPPRYVAQWRERLRDLKARQEKYLGMNFFCERVRTLMASEEARPRSMPPGSIPYGKKPRRNPVEGVQPPRQPGRYQRPVEE